MRELMFRAWDKAKKEYVFEGFHIIGELTALNVINQYWHKNLNDLEIEQFTGIYDRDGNPIYEGDVLEYYSALVPKGENPYIKQTVQWKVWHWGGIKNWKESRVIGNIHEMDLRKYMASR